MIVKFQRRLASNEEEVHVLAYNEDRSFNHMIIPGESALLSIFGDGEFKVYYETELTGDELTIVERVEDQDW